MTETEATGEGTTDVSRNLVTIDKTGLKASGRDRP
jgi:hypothetical protein